MTDAFNDAALKWADSFGDALANSQNHTPQENLTVAVQALDSISHAVASLTEMVGILTGNNSERWDCVWCCQLIRDIIDVFSSRTSLVVEDAWVSVKAAFNMRLGRMFPAVLSPIIKTAFGAFLRTNTSFGDVSGEDERGEGEEGGTMGVDEAASFMHLFTVCFF